MNKTNRTEVADGNAAGAPESQEEMNKKDTKARRVGGEPGSGGPSGTLCG